MLIHINGDDVETSLIGPGTTADLAHDPIADGNVGLVIKAGTDGVVVEGTLDKLRQLAWDGLTLPLPE